VARRLSECFWTALADVRDEQRERYQVALRDREEGVRSLYRDEDSFRKFLALETWETRSPATRAGLKRDDSATPGQGAEAGQGEHHER